MNAVYCFLHSALMNEETSVNWNFFQVQMKKKKKKLGKSLVITEFLWDPH